MTELRICFLYMGIKKPHRTIELRLSLLYSEQKFPYGLLCFPSPISAQCPNMDIRTLHTALPHAYFFLSNCLKNEKYETETYTVFVPPLKV